MAKTQILPTEQARTYAIGRLHGSPLQLPAGLGRSSQMKALSHIALLLAVLIIESAPLIAQSWNRTITFAGRDWQVKSGTAGPGPNNWSDSQSSVWVNSDGLHLKIRRVGSTWYCAEIRTSLPTRYGMQRFYAVGRLDQLDQNVIFSPFLYVNDDREIDIEFSNWSTFAPSSCFPSGAPAGREQYVLQPCPYVQGSTLDRFPFSLSGTYSTHYINWTSSLVTFKSIHGHYQEPPNPNFLIRQFTYSGSRNLTESEFPRIHINVWLVGGQPPSNGQEVEIIIAAADLPSASTFTISGYVRTSGGTGISGVTMSGLPGNPSTDANGYYTGTVDYNWSGTVTPSRTGYTFSPPSASYSNVTSNRSTNYTGTLQAFTISGYIRTAGGTGISGVTMSGLPGNPSTDANGYYTGTVDYNWSGTVTPTKAGYTFSPTSRSYSNVTSNRTDNNYTGTLQTFTISGYIRTSGGTGISGVTMNGLPGNASTDANGYYTGTVDYNWSGTVTPTKTGYTFSSPSTSYSNVTSNQTTDYTGTLQTFTISGYVRTSGGTSISGVTMNRLPGNPSTDASGFYTSTVDYGWSGAVRPTKTDYTFTPDSTSYTNVTSDKSTDYTGAVSTSVENISAALPDRYFLSQNFPNPFNPTTTIEFSLPKGSLVVLAIYNSVGLRLEVLVNEHLAAGFYCTQWNPRNIASGVYFYQLTTPEFTDTKKVLLLR
jgi:hypothetical protein